MSLMDKSPVLGLGKSLAEWSDAQMYEQNFSKILKFFIFDKSKNFENHKLRSIMI